MLDIVILYRVYMTYIAAKSLITYPLFSPIDHLFFLLYDRNILSQWNVEKKNHSCVVFNMQRFVPPLPQFLVCTKHFWCALEEAINDRLYGDVQEHGLQPQKKLIRLTASVSVPVVGAIWQPAGLSFGPTEVTSKVIGFLVLQKQTSPSVCVWPKSIERHKERKSRTMWYFLLTGNKLDVSPQVETFLLPESCFIAFLSLMLQAHFFPCWRSLLYL